MPKIKYQFSTASFLILYRDFFSIFHSQSIFFENCQSSAKVYCRVIIFIMYYTQSPLTRASDASMLSRRQRFIAYGGCGRRAGKRQQPLQAIKRHSDMAFLRHGVRLVSQFSAKFSGFLVLDQIVQSLSSRPCPSLLVSSCLLSQRLVELTPFTSHPTTLQARQHRRILYFHRSDNSSCNTSNTYKNLLIKTYKNL